MVPYLFAAIGALILINIGLILWLRACARECMRLTMECESLRKENSDLRASIRDPRRRPNSSNGLTDEDQIISDSIGNFGPGGCGF